MSPDSKTSPSWLLRMALRDSRRNRSRLLLFISSIVLGIAVLVAVYSLGDNLRSDIDDQAAALLGADLEVTGNKPAAPAIAKMIDSLGDQRAEKRSFASMVAFPNGGSRLTEVHALGGDFPFYGELETVPVQAGRSFRKARQALVDRTLMLQFGARVGDSVKVGALKFAIAGTLEKAPGQTGISASVAPAVYIPLQFLEATGLTQKGSRISYRYYVQWNEQTDVEAVADAIEKRLEAEGYYYDTVESQKEDTGRSFGDLSRFLSLVSFIALLLGCIGVASAIHIYIREKRSSIAILRCLGATARQAFLIYLIQILGIGLIGSVVGAALGVGIQQLLPLVLADLLPVEITTSVSWGAIGQGLVLGVVIALLFALLPLLSIRTISPLHTLRVSFEKMRPDRLRWLVYALIFAFILVFTRIQLGEWQEALVFTLSILGAFGILSLMALLLMWAVRRFFPAAWSYLWRQGLANLYRPNNQTAILIISIGLGTTFICTLLFIQSILLARVTLSASGNQPNMVLFDIQTAQRQNVMQLTRQQGLPVTETVPIVTMRLESINELTAARLIADSTIDMPRWVFSREYRVTYRDTLTAQEKITEGSWQGRLTDPAAPIPVSVEEGYAERTGMEIGDTLTFNVQGALMPAVVTSYRRVDWNRIGTNFLVVFPAGVLEAAPQFHVLLTRVPDEAAAARFQRAVVQQFPNISIIDLGLVLQVLDEILDKIGFVIRFMAAFSILTGLIVLITSVLISKYQRMQESVLLRTLGASRRQIFAITALEYFFLGALAALTGILLSVAAGWALARFSFETPFRVEWWPVLGVFLGVCGLTVLIGLLNSRGVVRQSPLEVLRED